MLTAGTRSAERRAALRVLSQLDQSIACAGCGHALDRHFYVDSRPGSRCVSTLFGGACSDGVYAAPGAKVCVCLRFVIPEGLAP